MSKRYPNLFFEKQWRVRGISAFDDNCNWL